MNLVLMFSALTTAVACTGSILWPAATLWHRTVVIGLVVAATGDFILGRYGWGTWNGFLAAAWLQNWNGRGGRRNRKTLKERVALVGQKLAVVTEHS